MNAYLIKPENSQLRNYIQYFLFFKKEDSETVKYTTFPNTNLCLAVYKNNSVEYDKANDINNCTVSYGKKIFTSRLYGFHKMPFQVSVKSSLDQICILFHPLALRFFTKESYENLFKCDDVFSYIFRLKQTDFLESLYDEKNLAQRANLLESRFLQILNSAKISPQMREALELISTMSNKQLSVEMIAKKLDINESTLFRLFANNIGQNPKTFLKTFRFRQTLNEVIKTGKTNFTQIAYDNYFFDQAHFIKDFKTFTGHTPKELNKRISVKEKELVWFYQ